MTPLKIESEVKFTPGPWQQHGSHLYSADPQRELICVVYGAGDSGLLIDNLRLIAAAPEMYEALKACQLQLLQSGDHHEYTEDALNMAAAALAKAVKP